MMNKKLPFAILWLFFAMPFSLLAQQATLEGRVMHGESPVPYATVSLPQLGVGTTADDEGHFKLVDISPGKHVYKISAVGFRGYSASVTLLAGETATLKLELEEDLLNLEQVVVTGSRSEVPLFDAPVIISRISDKTFENTQSLTLAEGLSFSPGLRLENNCQNCGFTQVRMNGLEGAYSQILINSRPVFSALMGVYGLELLPANMIDRVEVVRGAGSVLYGGNAIAGTINVITKDPSRNSLEVGINQAFINSEASDLSFSLNGTLVSEDQEKGVSFYAFNRNRDHWDANGDGFSEMTLLENTTVGMDAFLNPSDLSKLKLNAFVINELRRGGNKFDLMPHQTDITEQLGHNIAGGSIAFEQYLPNREHKFSFYGSAQATDRDSYYGGGGRVLQPGDELTPDDLLAINAYGEAVDLTWVGGLQYAYQPGKAWHVTLGTEYQSSDIEDEMPGYGRSIAQKVGTLGTYLQAEYSPSEKWAFNFGGRYDLVQIDGTYDLAIDRFVNDRNLQVFVPRFSAMFKAAEGLTFRAGYAQGYRAPQAFDEDLHIETVGGAARFTRLDGQLTQERSDSYTASVNWSESLGETQLNFVLEGFRTELKDAFVLGNAVQLDNGISVVTKRNGGGATVQGVNLEASAAFASKWVVQAGLTVQQAQYQQDEEIWAPEAVSESNADSVVTTRDILRTPNVYGFYSINFTPNDRWAITASGVATGSMTLGHVIDPETEYTPLKETPAFFEQNIRMAYTVPIDGDMELEVFGGIQNLLNSFQNDFDLGADRDAGYVYGPARPRTLFFGAKFRL